jgi:hypothetical protein
MSNEEIPRFKKKKKNARVCGAGVRRLVRFYSSSTIFIVVIW